MARLPSVVAAVCVCTLLGPVCADDYVVPEASVELLPPHKVKFSIPDEDGITLVAFHVNLNQEFDALDHGHWAKDVIKKRDGRWSWTFEKINTKPGDVLYYWIYVIKGLGYHGLDRSYKVGELSAGGPCTSTVRGQRVCGEVILEDHFDNLAGWSHEVFLGSSQDDEFMVFSQDKDVSFVQNGHLVVKPTLLDNKYGAGFVHQSLDLAGCTLPQQCSREAASYLILPPVLSARLTSRQRFTFRYGVVEVRAKLPRGDWIVPELWLSNTNNGGEEEGRVVLGLSRGNAPHGGELNSHVLQAGVVGRSSAHLGRMVQDKDWSTDFHTFHLKWTPDSMEFSVDGQQFYKTTPASVGVSPDKEYFVSLGVHVAGTRDFPDVMQNKPWRNSDPKKFLNFYNARNSWSKTWGADAALRVDYVKVTAL